LIEELCSRIENKPMTVIEQVRFEMEYLQYTTYVNHSVGEFYYIVIQYKTYKDATRPYLTVRNIKTGEEMKTKIKKGSIFKTDPFGLYSILRIEGFTYDFKRKMINGEWSVTDELEPILESYEVIK